MSESIPLVTIITVSYNSEKFIQDAIESVLAQNYDNIEYIIADDCSTDRSWEIISQYNDARIEKYRNSKNLGEYPNRNKALQKATGKYTMFIDGDDVILSHAVTYFVSLMEKHSNINLLIQKGYYNNIIFPIILKPEQIFINTFFGNNLLSSSFTSNFFVTETLKKFGLSTKYISGDDEIRLRIGSKFPVLFVAGWVTWPRETPGQASSKIRPEINLLDTIDFTKEILKNSNINSNIKRAIDNKLKKNTFSTLMHLLKRGQSKKFLKIKKVCGLSYQQLIKYRLVKVQQSDIFEEFSPEKPFKMNSINYYEK